MNIPELDDTTIRMEAMTIASTLDNSDVFALLGNADIILEWIDPLSAQGIVRPITLAKQV